MEPVRPFDAQDRPDCPELRLWRQALALLIVDAARHHEGRKPWAGQAEAGELAYRDVLSCGFRLKWLCAMNGYDPNYYSQRFRRWTESHPAGVPLDGRAKGKRITSPA